MPYRGRKQRSLSSSIRAQKSSNGRRDVDLGTSPVNELARVLESTHLAVALTERASRNQERPVALAQVSAVNNHRPKAEADIDAYVQGVLAGITPSDADLLLKRNECRRIEVIVQRVLPNTDLKIMGGTANTFALKDSDVDICIVGVHGSRTLDASEVNRLSNELRQKGTDIRLNLQAYRHSV